MRDLVVWEVCQHGSRPPHTFYPFNTMEPAEECEGGREIVLRRTDMTDVIAQTHENSKWGRPEPTVYVVVDE